MPCPALLWCRQAGDRTDIWVIRHQPAPHDDVGFSLPLGHWAAAPGCLPRVAAVAQATQQFWLMLFQGWEEHTRVRLRKLAPYLNTTSEDTRLLRAWAIDLSVAYQEAAQRALSIDSMVLPTTGVCLRLRDVTKTSRKQKVCAVMYRNVSSRAASWTWAHARALCSSAAAQLPGRPPAQLHAARCTPLLLLQGC